MYSFIHQMGDDAVNSGKKGWLVAILELGAWLGVLCTGYLADKLSRKFTIIAAVVVFVRLSFIVLLFICGLLENRWY